MKSALAAHSLVALASCAAAPPAAEAQAFSAAGKTLRQIYEHLHANPELSFQEKNSSAILAAEMKRLGFDVATGVGDKWIKARAWEKICNGGWFPTFRSTICRSWKRAARRSSRS
jgi:hippurate hydrolase